MQYMARVDLLCSGHFFFFYFIYTLYVCFWIGCWLNFKVLCKGRKKIVLVFFLLDMRTVCCCCFWLYYSIVVHFWQPLIFLLCLCIARNKSVRYSTHAPIIIIIIMIKIANGIRNCNIITHAHLQRFHLAVKYNNVCRMWITLSYYWCEGEIRINPLLVICIPTYTHARTLTHNPYSAVRPIIRSAVWHSAKLQKRVNWRRDSSTKKYRKPCAESKNGQFPLHSVSRSVSAFSGSLDSLDSLSFFLSLFPSIHCMFSVLIVIDGLFLCFHVPLYACLLLLRHAVRWQRNTIHTYPHANTKIQNKQIQAHT